MAYDPDDFTAFQQLYESVTKLPELLTSDAEFSEAIQRHTRPDREGERNVRVLLSIAVSQTGAVDAVRAIQPVLPPGVHVVAIHSDVAGDVIVGAASVAADPRLIAAAEAIGRTLQFRPAEKEGTPVAFPDVRISIDFG